MGHGAKEKGEEVMRGSTAIAENRERDIEKTKFVHTTRTTQTNSSRIVFI